MHDPIEPHFLALKRIFSYVSGILDYDLQLYSSSTPFMVAYSDVDRVNLSWSSAKADYRGVANDVVETCWLRNLLQELHMPLFSATLGSGSSIHVPSRYQFANIFTKSLPTTFFDEFHSSLSV
ncbi:ribonuclease H-like domain-containing protein [Tanacetum coccineum]